jgi:hypothetical protein
MRIEKITFDSLKIIDVFDYIKDYKVKFKNLTEDELHLKLTLELMLLTKLILAHKWKLSNEDKESQQHVFTFDRFWCYSYFKGYTCAGRILRDAIFDGRLLLNGVRFNFDDRFFTHKNIIYLIQYSTLPITGKVLINSKKMESKFLLKNLIICNENL